MNLLPKTRIETGSYLCTWCYQAYTAFRAGLKGSGGSEMRDALTPELLFGETSNYHFIPRELRENLYFLIDDGWDVPPHTGNLSGHEPSPFGSLIPDPARFGSLGNSPYLNF